MNDEVFNLSVRKFLKHFGVTAQREIERSVGEAVRSGRLSGSEELSVSARLSIDGVLSEHVVEGKVSLDE